MKKRILSILLTVVLLAAAVLPGSAAGLRQTDAQNVLRVGTPALSGRFNPFYYSTTYDGAVVGLTQLALFGTDREANPVLKGIEGETRAYNGTDYTYYGIADCEITENEDGSVDYQITIRDDVRFSDGELLTMKDVLFSIYTLCDPTYTGSSTLCSLPIEGIDAYRSGMGTAFDLFVAAGPDNTDFSYWTEEEQTAFWADVEQAGVAFAQEIVDYLMANYADDGAVDVASSAAMWGFDIPEDGTVADFWNEMYEAYKGDLNTLSNYESAGSALTDLLEGDYFYAIKTGESAASISGIRQLSDTELKIHLTEVDITAIYSLGISVLPMHYYGDPAKYNGVDSFGFAKGDLSAIRAKNAEPLGAGPFVFQSWEDGVVTLTKNENYYLGAPKLDAVQFVEGCYSLQDIAEDRIDVTDNVSLHNGAVEELYRYNNGKLSGDIITTITTDNLGYGYIGINADLVKVGDARDSAASKNLRKAYATLLAAYRYAAIEDYYGECANVIEYPISDTSWAAPKPADDGYEAAFSRDVNGNPIYADGMSETEKYNAALEAAKGFFEAAGFTLGDKDNPSNVPELTAIIPADGIGDHPSYKILTETAAALETIGVKLTVYDTADGNILWDGLDNNTIAMWAAAWGSAADPDMYQVYHSDNVAGSGTGSNHYCITSDQLDELIVAARSTVDQAHRKELYKQCLDIIMDWGVEVPVYQRQNGVFLSTERIDIDSLTPDITTFWGWQNDIEKLSMRTGFVDIPTGAYYTDAVDWAVENGVTNGTSATTFSPENTCTRGQIVTFLWRAKGCPEPTSTENPFTDVKESDYFYKAVLWAKETGVTSGTSADKFSPGNACTRAQVVTFLWRAEGCPEPEARKSVCRDKPCLSADERGSSLQTRSGANPFEDVPEDQYYTKAVLWAVGKGVTTGTTATTFSPNRTCTRGQIVTFLYRDLG